jgi:hypothetical protein
VLVEAVADLLLAGLAGLVAPGRVQAPAQDRGHGPVLVWGGVALVVDHDVGDLQAGVDVLAWVVVGAVVELLLGDGAVPLRSEVP